jgi:A/G-specific adenine glycosylase
MIGQKLISWYSLNKRVLPWRDIENPYLIWVSEIILQQTRVVQGLAYYRRFADTYPDIFS